MNFLLCLLILCIIVLVILDHTHFIIKLCILAIGCLMYTHSYKLEERTICKYINQKIKIDTISISSEGKILEIKINEK